MDAKQKAAEEKRGVGLMREATADDWDDVDRVKPTPVRKRKPVQDWSDEEIQPSQTGARKKLNFEVRKKKKKNDGMVQDSQYQVEDDTDDSE